MSDIIRVVRILEYTGPADDLDFLLKQNQVKGYRQFGKVEIREATMPFPEIMKGIALPIKAKELSKTSKDFIDHTKANNLLVNSYLHMTAEYAIKMQDELEASGYRVTREGLKVTLYLDLE